MGVSGVVDVRRGMGRGGLGTGGSGRVVVVFVFVVVFAETPRSGLVPGLVDGSELTETRERPCASPSSAAGRRRGVEPRPSVRTIRKTR